MSGKCNICGYSTGEQGGVTGVQDKINTDGGQMTGLYDLGERPSGWVIRCPQCRNYYSMRLEGDG